MDKKQELERISNYAGIRFDLIQAGGGNSSVKIDNHTMLVKASGIVLSELNETSGYVAVNYKKIRDWFKTEDLQGLNRQAREQKGKDLTTAATVSETGKPSIETFLHALLNTYTLHTHPLSVNAVTARSDWIDILKEIFPDAVFVIYATPGIDLALELFSEIKNKSDLPKIFFLQNHGLIVSCETYREVIDLTEQINATLNTLTGLDLDRYGAVTALQKTVAPYWASLPVVYCSDDALIKELISTESKELELWPFCPDTLVYCGVSPVYMCSVEDSEPLNRFNEKYAEPAKVIVIRQQVYFLAATIKKAREAEELLKFHLLAVSANLGQVDRLPREEIAYLSNWDAEKYRQEI